MAIATLEDLEAGLPAVRAAPPDVGRLELIVRRPGEAVREIMEEVVLDPERGLEGDTWLERGSDSTADGSADPACQVTIMNARYAALIAGDLERWAEAGDQLYVDMDISTANLPAGTRLSIGTAVVEISQRPHTGCAKFSARFGSEALRIANSPQGRELRLRGVNTTIVTRGTIRTGDVVRRVPSTG